VSNFQKAKPLNTISPCQPNEAAARTSRHLRQCAELADLAMQLARAAAARTLTDWAEPAAPHASATQSLPAAETHAACEMAPRANATPAPAPRGTATAASYKPTDPAVLFTRLAAVVRDCIALEARLAAGPAPSPRAAGLSLRADPRRAPLREALRHATENHPDHAELLRETTTRLDEQLANDPDQTAEPAHLFATICNELGVELDLATLPDEYLNAFAETLGLDDRLPVAPDPRATSPP
jgi:hypothetical protein